MDFPLCHWREEGLSFPVSLNDEWAAWALVIEMKFPYGHLLAAVFLILCLVCVSCISRRFKRISFDDADQKMTWTWASTLVGRLFCLPLHWTAKVQSKFLSNMKWQPWLRCVFPVKGYVEFERKFWACRSKIVVSAGTTNASTAEEMMMKTEWQAWQRVSFLFGSLAFLLMMRTMMISIRVHSLSLVLLSQQMFYVSLDTVYDFWLCVS